MLHPNRSDENPVFVPNPENWWEANGALNGCIAPAGFSGGYHFVYRALSLPTFQHGVEMELSTIGYAKTKDGIHFGPRRQIIVPEYDWEQFGCEDPRVTRFNGKYYIFYTALSTWPFGADGIKSAVAITSDFKKFEKHPVTPFNSKAMALFPDRVAGRMGAIVTANTDRPPAKISFASFEKESDIWDEEFWNRWYSSLEEHVIPLQRNAADQVEAGVPPIKTAKGWLFIYSYIQNYHSPHPKFTIEAALLDLKDPRKVLGHSKYPLLLPEAEYEVYGKVPHIVFPTGAIVVGKKLRIYYGAADTATAVAEYSLDEVIADILRPEHPAISFTRNPANPILQPIADHAWENVSVFNPAAYWDGKKVHLLYRAMGRSNESVFGYAAIQDSKVVERLPEPVYTPRADFEKKGAPHVGNGCEDPRITKIGDTLYVMYTAYTGVQPPRIALTSIKEKDFLNKKWNWTQPVITSPAGVDDKDGCILPEKVDGKYMIFHRMHNWIDISFVKNLSFEGECLKEERWMHPRRGHWDGEKVGISAPPIKIPAGWLLFYHGVGHDKVYRAGAVLLDKKDPRRILARTYYPLFEPEEIYEKEGVVDNVVFPCGAVLVKDHILLYYGGGDKVIGEAVISLQKIMEALT